MTLTRSAIWVMKTIEIRGGTDQDFTVSSVERRVIGYFE